jgi:hypothetical protein
MGNFPLWNGSASNNSTVQNGNIARGTFRSDAGQLRFENPHLVTPRNLLA